MLNTNDFLPGKYQQKPTATPLEEKLLPVHPPTPSPSVSPVSSPAPSSTPSPNFVPTQNNEQTTPPSPPPAIKNPKRAKKKNNLAVSLAVFLLLAVGAGASFLLVKQNQDVRQQASVDVPYNGIIGGPIVPPSGITLSPTLTTTQAPAGCTNGWYACNVGCCGVGGGPNEGKRYAPALGTGTVWNSNEDLSARADGDEIQAAVVNELKSRGLVNDNGTIRLTENFETEALLNGPNGKKILDYCYPGGTLDTSKCRIMPGGYLYIGGSRDGDPCAPVLNGGGDWCAEVAGNGSTREQQLCSNLGLIRCICNNGVGVIGSQGQSCDDLCGGTDNICESCDDDDEPGDDPTDPPTVTPLICRRIDILDAQNSPLTGDADQSFVPGETELKFKCASSANERVDHFEFQLLVPPSNSTGDYFSETIDLTEDPLSKGISESYLIERAGSYQVQCRVCESASSCQAWENNWTDTQYSIN